ncbi:probable LRR receptor-like serine/threonine-protein kinase At4g37250 isoform X2 [Zingiber officinale]|uniref:probable LRR receptor-like serine/threonine-protein kinase At4g37250 isoform X2 n=1 Tax=Zingiber officinale TaxID=94328 RepID=UPI001C4B4AA7|nr:probable LRR receptor-like serine/threonine-protein kinase At4g37250 isoform X2 [Zingiber officinale]
MKSSKCVLALLLPLLLLVASAFGFDDDGELLLHFKRSVVSDPLATLEDWNSDDATPCSWNGVACMGFPCLRNATASVASRVVSLILPDSRLSGRIPPELGFLEHLRHLDLSGNALNGTLPASILNASELRVLSLADNEISGEFPDLDAGRLSNLQVLNLSGNALEGEMPATLALLPSLTVVSLANNYLSGELTDGGFGQVEYLDLSSNLINGTIPTGFGGRWLQYLNLSHNLLTGEIPPALASVIPPNATVCLAFNNLTGSVPQEGAFALQKPVAFAGNPGLCGAPLENLCTIPSTFFYKPPDSDTEAPLTAKSPPAIAVLPKNAEGNSPTNGGKGQGRLRPAVVIAIAVGDMAGIGLILAVFFYVYQAEKKKSEQRKETNHEKQQPPATDPECHVFGGFPWCLTKKGNGDSSDETSGESSSAETETEEELHGGRGREDGSEGGTPPPPRQLKPQRATLVTVDGEPQLELETLLKASAFVIGATGSSIVYKAVLADGTALAVRRIGDGCTLDRLKDFEAQVRGLAKFRHPNLLRLRGFYWGADEKLLIHDFASKGSLANISFTKKPGSSVSSHLNWESRLRVARGLARGLAYLHEKKATHGNIKLSNVLLDSEMQPKIADFGLDHLISGDGGPRLSASARLFGTKRPVQLQSSNSTELPSPASSGVTEVSPRASTSSTAAAALTTAARYQAPERLKYLKPNAKWDVYSFGALLLELVAGRPLSEAEIGQGSVGFMVEERNRILRMADPTVRGEVEGREEALLSCFKLGFACCAVAPHRRPSMKDAVQVLEKAVLATSGVSSTVGL